MGGGAGRKIPEKTVALLSLWTMHLDFFFIVFNKLKQGTWSQDLYSAVWNVPLFQLLVLIGKAKLGTWLRLLGHLTGSMARILNPINDQIWSTWSLSGLRKTTFQKPDL